jgi:hypothetical protein
MNEEQKEPLHVLRDTSTYHQRAQWEADQEHGGRFKELGEARVTGVPEYPAQPPTSPWAGPDLVPPEPPLGFDVNALEPVGTPIEVAQSLAGQMAPTTDAPSIVVVETDARPRQERDDE